METQWARVDDWATWTYKRGKEREKESGTLPRSPGLLQLAVVVYQPPRCNLIRALSHERTESALHAGPLLLSPPPLFPPPSTFSLSPFLSLSLSSSIVVVRLDAARCATCYTTLFLLKATAPNPKFRRYLHFKKTYY